MVSAATAGGRVSVGLSGVADSAGDNASSRVGVTGAVLQLDRIMIAIMFAPIKLKRTRDACFNISLFLQTHLKIVSCVSVALG
jgi:hypothetical protein